MALTASARWVLVPRRWSAHVMSWVTLYRVLDRNADRDSLRERCEPPQLTDVRRCAGGGRVRRLVLALGRAGRFGGAKQKSKTFERGNL